MNSHYSHHTTHARKQARTHKFAYLINATEIYIYAYMCTFIIVTSKQEQSVVQGEFSTNYHMNIIFLFVCARPRENRRLFLCSSRKTLLAQSARTFSRELTPRCHHHHHNGTRGRDARQRACSRQTETRAPNSLSTRARARLRRRHSGACARDPTIIFIIIISQVNL